MRILLFLSLTLCLCGDVFSQQATPADSTHPTSPPLLKPTLTIKPELSIYPNPAKNKITVQVKNFNPGMAMVRVIDTKGNIHREENRLLTDGTEDIIMFLMLKPGIYFIMVSEPGKMAKKKLMLL